MFLTFTDFGFAGPYLGQMRAALMAQAPAVPVIDLMADAPAFDPRASAYLLAAFCRDLPPVRRVVIAVVDPGVGGPRDPLMLHADGTWYVGPDNGLLSRIARQAGQAELWRIDWRPPTLSRSFHGRDLFAPVAAALWQGQPVAATPRALADSVGAGWPDDLAEILYCDAYGNAMTGLRAATLATTATLQAGGHSFAHAGTFAEVPPGCGFWYENSSGLAEIACRDASAQQRFGLHPGLAIALT